MSQPTRPLALIPVMLLGSLLVGSPARAEADWARFRGPNGQGVDANSRLPLPFGPQTNQVWKSPLPPGHSSPILWENSIYLTGHDPNRSNALITLALDRRSGRVRWTRDLPTRNPSGFHALNNAAASTPAADADRVYVYFGTYGLVAYDHAGQTAWEHPLETPKSKYGMATSPMLYQNTLLLVQDGDAGSSRLLALDRATGKLAWESPRPLFRAGWSTPVIFPHGDSEDLVVLGSKRLTAYNPANGEERWWAAGFPDETVGVPALAENLLIAGAAALGGRGDDSFDAAATWKMTLDEFDTNRDGRIQSDEVVPGFAFIQRPELPKSNPGYALPVGRPDAVRRMLDHDKDGTIVEDEWMRMTKAFTSASQPYLAAFRPGAKLDARPDHVAWETRRGIPETPSPLCTQGRLYLLRDGGLLTCLQSATGKELFRERLGAAGQYVASPVATRDLLVTASVAGILTVIRMSDSLEIVSRSDLGEEIYATPAIADHTLFVRTATNLWAFGKP